MQFTVAQKVRAVVMTSSPGPMLPASRLRWSAAVQEFTRHRVRRPLVVAKLTLQLSDLRAGSEPAGPQTTEYLALLLVADQRRPENQKFLNWCQRPPFPADREPLRGDDTLISRSIARTSSMRLALDSERRFAEIGQHEEFAPAMAPARRLCDRAGPARGARLQFSELYSFTFSGAP